jgi:hypothetical protein
MHEGSFYNDMECFMGITWDETLSSKTCYKNNFINKTRPKEKWRKLYIIHGMLQGKP